MDDPASLLNSERRYPDRNEAVLPERQAKFRVASDIEKESAVAARANQLRSAKRNPTQNEGTGIVGKLLPALPPFLADENDGLKLTKPEPRDVERREEEKLDWSGEGTEVRTRGAVRSDLWAAGTG